MQLANVIDAALHGKITDLPKICATRNKVAHEYDIVDPLQLYTIVVKNIPVLIEELRAIIENLEKKND